MKQFYMKDYPKFKQHCYRNSTGYIIPFEDHLQTSGFKSAIRGSPGKGFEMSDEDFTWFVLRWS
jgi:hypothetical protein